MKKSINRNGVVKESARPAFVGPCLEVKKVQYSDAGGQIAGTRPKVAPRPTINQRYNPDVQIIRACYQQEFLGACSCLMLPTGHTDPGRKTAENFAFLPEILKLVKEQCLCRGASSKTITRPSVGLKRLRFPSWPFSCPAVAGMFPFGRTLS